LYAIFKLQVAAYDTKDNKMAFFDPTRAKDFLFISGTKVFDSLSFNQMFQVPQTLTLIFVNNTFTLHIRIQCQVRILFPASYFESGSNLNKVNCMYASGLIGT